MGGHSYRGMRMDTGKPLIGTINENSLANSLCDHFFMKMCKGSNWKHCYSLSGGQHV